MEFLNFNRIFWNWSKKYMFYPKLCEIKIVDLLKTNNFAFLCFFRILHIIVKKIEIWKIILYDNFFSYLV